MEVIKVHEMDMTEECWTVQVEGLEACDFCQYKDTINCSGQEIRATGMNENGLAVPIGINVR